MKPPFIIQKTSNHGTENPIVARLAIQTVNLIKWLAVDDQEKKAIIDIYLDLQRRLLNCYDIHQRLLLARENTLADAVTVWSQGQRTIPHVIGLQEEVESFLFAAKTYLREVARLLNKLFQADLKNDSSIFWDPKGRESDVAIWAKRHFGEDHETAKMLASEADWIGEVIRSRNAIEHPEGWSGTLIINNFEARPEGIVPPSWARQGAQAKAPSDLYNDIQITLDNLLTFAEDLLVDAVRANPVFPQIIIVHIPEAERNKDVPIRYDVTVDLTNIKR